MKKKLLSVVLATAMALSVCACGNEPQASVSTEETKVATSEVVSSEVVSSEVVEEALYPIVDEPITIKVKSFFNFGATRNDTSSIISTINTVFSCNCSFSTGHS